ncbi:SDR family NAD(P)-dependent oxidoreductase [Streptomyces sp. QTS52]
MVIDCAGVGPRFSRSEWVTDEDWQRVIAVNLQGTVHCRREAGRVMLEQGSGSIVNPSSVHASTGFEQIAAYAAGEGGVEALTESPAVGWADRGGAGERARARLFPYGSQRRPVGQPLGERVVRGTPLGGVGAPEELGGAAVFLASDASRFVTGTTVTVDGGCTARRETLRGMGGSLAAGR